MKNMPKTTRFLLNTLKDVQEWLECGKINNIEIDKQSLQLIVVDSILYAMNYYNKTINK